MSAAQTPPFEDLRIAHDCLEEARHQLRNAFAVLRRYDTLSPHVQTAGEKVKTILKLVDARLERMEQPL